MTQSFSSKDGDSGISVGLKPSLSTLSVFPRRQRYINDRTTTGLQIPKLLAIVRDPIYLVSALCTWLCAVSCVKREYEKWRGKRDEKGSTDKVKKVKGAGEYESEISERIQYDSVSIGHNA